MSVRRTGGVAGALFLAGVLAAGLFSPARAEKLSGPALIEMARKDPASAAFRTALVDTLGDQRLKAGNAYVGQGPDFLFAIRSEKMPELLIDDEAAGPLRQTEDGIWFLTTQLKTGRNHHFYYLVDGVAMGGDRNVVAYGPDSYVQPGVPQGVMSPKMVHTSKIYDGMVSDYWVYVPAQYDPNTPAGVMIWTDGGGHISRDGGDRAPNVIDNLTAQKKMPVCIHIFTSPGDISVAPGTKTFDYVTNFSKMTGRTLRDSMRSTEYDTVSDRYVNFLENELIAEVGQKYKLRKDGYSRAITGASSGGIAAFNVAWQRPDLFSRVLCHVGTFTSIQWIPGQLDGGNILPFAVRKTPRKNIRFYHSDGSEDLENEHGSWPMQNIQMANSLKMMGYDFHFSFSGSSHSGSQSSAELPAALTWLWRDYDPAKTSQEFQQDPAEKNRPYFRVLKLNRTE
jgi:enterochelin esterase-like enzyme